MPAVARLSITPVKSLGLQHPDEVLLERTGVAENRRFFLVDAGGRLFNGVGYGPLVRVRADYDPQAETLALRFPDGAVIEGELRLAETVETDFYGRPVAGRVVAGPWAKALSAYIGAGVRLIRAERAGDACDVHVATLVSDGSLAELARRAGRKRIDARRFRMLIGLEGCAPHEEDGWAGRRVRIGGTVVRVVGPVPRCAVTTQDPATGVRDLDTLRTIKSYRGVRAGDKIDFGVYADVLEPGRVRVGDTVQPL